MKTNKRSLFIVWLGALVMCATSGAGSAMAQVRGIAPYEEEDVALPRADQGVRKELIPDQKQLEEPAPQDNKYFDHPLFGKPNPPKPGDNIFVKYERFMNEQIKKIGDMDLYGVTSQLPQGYLGFKWDWGFLKASRRFDQNRHTTNGFPPIEFKDGNGNKQLSLDLGLSGRGGGHTIQVSIGLIDELDWYIEIPITYMDVRLDPVANEIDDEGNRVNPTLGTALGISDTKSFNGQDFVRHVLPKLGRAPVGLRYKGEWVLGDINTGFSWNYYRSHRMSAALTPRVFFPTGRIADPNNSLLYGTGPEIDVSVGGWGVGATQGYDIRIYEFPPWISLIASSELSVAYYFPHKRNYPTNFTKPDPAVAALDPSGDMFPDLSNLSGSFTYWPGLSVNWSVLLNAQLSIIGIGVGYGIMYSQEPELKADPAFVRMVKGLELLGQQTTHLIQVGATLNLLALYIPLEIGFTWKKMVDGSNAIIFDDFFQITFKGYLPLFPK
ncbi:MAG: hypothetical protein GXP54_01115 [Deltaproteobacteria bacterium]|nr:hypothetical protein [Deltaproteobacteria bacterium]